MSKRILSRVDVLENEERSRKLDQQASVATISFFCRKIVLAYYVGGLKLDDEDPGEAEARALNYDSRKDYLEALLKGEKQEINRRFKNAARRLFVQAGLNFDRSPPSALFESFVWLVNQLPEPWLSWLQSNLKEGCHSAAFGTRSNIALEFSRLLPQRSARATKLSRNSRVFTQISQALFSPVVEDLLREERKACFWAFRRYIRPRMTCGWWQHEVADELQRFYRSLINGERPKLVLMAPPQHGKTEQVMDFLAWIAGRRPDLKTIFVSYSDELGVKVNRDLQRIMTSERYVALFGHRLADSGSGWLRNSDVLEYVNHRGSFRNTTVEGQITGQGLDIGAVDDPIKGRAEASSKAVRDKIWDWFTDDFFTRFSDSAGLLMIMTRWHLDDPIGRFTERFPDARILRYPAIAEEDEKNRRKGEALFPEHKSLPFLIERRRMMTKAGWESEYQQNPIVVGGGIFPIDKLDIIPSIDRKKIRASVRYVDKAGTKDGGAYSAMVLMHRTHDKQYIVEDVVRGQWSALEREQRLRQAAQIDKTLCPAGYTVWVEQEPGNGGNVALKAAAWNRDFMDELESFPSGKFKDQVDAASGAFNKLALTSNYNWSGSWI